MKTKVLGFGALFVVLASVWYANLKSDYVPRFQIDDLSGVRVTESVFKNGGVLHFFRTSCGYCVRELNIWDDIQNEYPDLAVVTVILGESEQKARFFFTDYNPFTHVAMDSSDALWSSLGSDYGYIPFTLVVDKSRRVVARFGSLNEDNIESFKQHLDQL
ncbi:TlpA family protein disulfide reductase [Candidatus Comchoanobacter bicostacola]|uniref:TlpA family protein disulfide reductase n=1 Tax=Candidatus Comchoanobacter bicostacola TaxID=2919598 RepID=A0ABY5DMZ9_9GAMM|nr:TlpA disulfide reductase family protein [Candidatus Comchoanobacter bicostacola]UTC24925.1 TlpA family protein disulfide reductase [Candidatus Comchoanobacter bicostacola]